MSVMANTLPIPPAAVQAPPRGVVSQTGPILPPPPPTAAAAAATAAATAAAVTSVNPEDGTDLTDLD